MRQITVDLATYSHPLFAGYVGEHNATEITVIKPDELSGAMYSIAFATNGEVIHSQYFSDDEEIKVTLWQQLTQDNEICVQLEAYDEVGKYLGKSAVAKLVLSNSAHGIDVIADTDNPDVYSEIAQNSWFRETLEDNVDTLDKLTTSENGKLLFDGKSIGSTSGEGISDELYEEIEENTKNRHWHDNKDVLDNFGWNYNRSRPTFGGSSQSYALALIDDVNQSVGYLRRDLEGQISLIPKFSIIVVDALPTTDINYSAIYLVRDTETSGNLYTEYIYVKGKWEELGTQSVDVEIPTTEELVDAVIEALPKYEGEVSEV
jgi:hypothetical protein